MFTPLKGSKHQLQDTRKVPVINDLSTNIWPVSTYPRRKCTKVFVDTLLQSRKKSVGGKRLQ